jgi:flagellin
MTVINTNIAATVTANAMKSNQRLMETSMERLATGVRVNSASDDAAGLAIGSKMDSQIRGLQQAVRNANDGINMIQTADGAAEEIGNMLQRMREISVQAANEVNSTTDLTNLNKEFAALSAEIERIAGDTKFNGLALTDGSDTSKTLFVGADYADTVAVTFSDLGLNGAAVAAVQAVYDFAGVTDAQLTANKIAGTDTVLNIGGTTNTIDVSAIGTAATKAVIAFTLTDANVTAFDDAANGFTFNDANGVSYSMIGIQAYTAVSQVVDNWNDNFAATSGFTASETIDGSGATTHFVLTQTNDPTTAYNAANFTFAVVDAENPGLANGYSTKSTSTNGVAASLSVAQLVAAAPFSSAINGFNLTDNGGVLRATQATGAAFTGAMTTDNLGSATETTTGVTASNAGVMGRDLSSWATAGTVAQTSTTIGYIDTAISNLAGARADFGASINRLEYTVDALGQNILDTQEARSTIMDTDYAAETTELARTQIIAQASTAMLSQANQQAQSVLALLQ